MAAVVVAAAAGCEESRRPGRSCGAAGRNQHPAAPAASRQPPGPVDRSCRPDPGGERPIRPAPIRVAPDCRAQVRSESLSESGGEGPAPSSGPHSTGGVYTGEHIAHTPARTHTHKMHAHARERGRERGEGESGAGDGAGDGERRRR